MMSRIGGEGRAALLFSVILLLGGIATAGFAQTMSPPPPVSGTIASISGMSVTLVLPDKTQKTVTLDSKTLVLERDPADLSQIQTGDSLGVTSHRSGADMVASNINIFAKEMLARVPMTQFQMKNPVDTMTNGAVTGSMQGMNGHTLTVKYDKGTSAIVVPDGTPIYRLVSVKQSALAPGMQISVRPTPGSGATLKAASISFDGPAKS